MESQMGLLDRILGRRPEPVTMLLHPGLSSVGLHRENLARQGMSSLLANGPRNAADAPSCHGRAAGRGRRCVEDQTRQHAGAATPGDLRPARHRTGGHEADRDLVIG